MPNASSANNWLPSSRADDDFHLGRLAPGSQAPYRGSAARRCDLALAEDCVQDVLVTAMQHWPAEGWPERPGAWLMTAAKHRLLDRMRHVQMTAREQQALGHDADARTAHLVPDPLDLLLADEADEVSDNALRLMFIACTPSWRLRRNGRSPCAWWPVNPSSCRRHPSAQRVWTRWRAAAARMH